ncbi:hypothetical protein KTR66_04690 [Roseococcus sp. SDR]|uniref:hypothetical protein n=1 Tax=Roseococcus sp. SDR TaxID=2835532 RepID=UPI001BD04C2B|nr:hypothetical protein [Roseococcus sp. SDR]MBS7789277.1 hypothetical protein [Roseococcus sp. SDR]MBV1844591.1 hypothetical protein [Roseococcus sp. SDR]
MKPLAITLMGLTWAGSALAYTPADCRAIDRAVRLVIAAESERAAPLEALNNIVMPHGRSQPDTPLGQAHTALMVEMFDMLQRHARLLRALEDYQHQLRLCGRQP